MQTDWNSWACTMATTPLRPSSSDAVEVGPDMVELAVVPKRVRSGFFRVEHGQGAAERQKPLPHGKSGCRSFGEETGEGTGKPRCSVKKVTT